MPVAYLPHPPVDDQYRRLLAGFSQQWPQAIASATAQRALGGSRPTAANRQAGDEASRATRQRVPAARRAGAARASSQSAAREAPDSLGTAQFGNAALDSRGWPAIGHATRRARKDILRAWDRICLLLQ